MLLWRILLVCATWAALLLVVWSLLIAPFSSLPSSESHSALQMLTSGVPGAVLLFWSLVAAVVTALCLPLVDRRGVVIRLAGLAIALGWIGASSALPAAISGGTLHAVSESSRGGYELWFAMWAVGVTSLIVGFALWVVGAAVERKRSTINTDEVAGSRS